MFYLFASNKMFDKNNVKSRPLAKTVDSVFHSVLITHAYETVDCYCIVQ